MEDDQLAEERRMVFYVSLSLIVIALDKVEQTVARCREGIPHLSGINILQPLYMLLKVFVGQWLSLSPGSFPQTIALGPGYSPGSASHGTA